MQLSSSSEASVHQTCVGVQRAESCLQTPRGLAHPVHCTGLTAVGTSRTWPVEVRCSLPPSGSRICAGPRAWFYPCISRGIPSSLQGRATVVLLYSVHSAFLVPPQRMSLLYPPQTTCRVDEQVTLLRPSNKPASLLVESSLEERESSYLCVVPRDFWKVHLPQHGPLWVPGFGQATKEMIGPFPVP